MLLPKRYKIIKAITGLRLTLPFSIGWSENDYVDIDKIDDDTLIIKKKRLN